MMNNKYINNFGLLLLVVFLPFSLCFILSCLFRTMSSVLVPSLEQQIPISTEQLGFLTAVYFLAQGLFQIPLGILLDKFGPKKVQVILLLVATVGLLISSTARHVWEVVIANILIGVGMAGGLMSALKIIVQWFPMNKIPILNGLMMTFGGLGIILAATPTSILAGIFSWSEIHLFFAMLTFLIALLILAIVPNSNKYTCVNKESFKHHIQGVIDIYKSAYFWRIAPLIASILGSFMAFPSVPATVRQK